MAGFLLFSVMKLQTVMEQQVQSIRRRLEYLELLTPESKEREMIVIKNGIAALDEMIAAEKKGVVEW